MHEEPDFFKSHAAAFYRRALEAGEITGLKKNLIEQRIKDVKPEIAVGEASSLPTTKSTASAMVRQDAAPTASGKAWQEKGNTAWLTLDNGAKIEFAKCPAGEFKQFVAVDKSKVNVRITRDFWIMKKPLTLKEVSDVPRISIGNCKDGSVLRMNFNKSNRVMEWLSEAYGREFPDKMVLRWPTAAEWEYAFHANTQDRSSPFFEMNPGHADRKKDFGLNSSKLSMPNNWGISFPDAHERLLDVYSEDSLNAHIWDRAKDPNGTDSNELPKYHSTTDPFSWSDDEKVAMLAKRAGYKTWKLFYDWGGSNPAIRFVVGPDLVSEWRARDGKK